MKRKFAKPLFSMRNATKLKTRLIKYTLSLDKSDDQVCKLMFTEKMIEGKSLLLLPAKI
ncbi:MAG: hypothetical protein SH856_11905 [Flavobacteriales bacterium]|nr:hypothetical protein [Flavobacteriales bacterium]